jgi:hypothetical protein
MIVTSRKVGPVFTATQWIKNGGAAIGTDSDPNTSPPPANRIAQLPSSIFGISIFSPFNVSGLGIFATLISADGTAITVRPWWKDDLKGEWVPLTTAVTLTTAGNNFQQLSIRVMPGAKFFVQVTANTGVTKMCLLIR